MFVVMAVAAFSAVNITAHPGHDLMSHGWTHTLTSSFHLSILACGGLAALVIGRVLRKPLAAKYLRYAGITAIAAAAILFGMSSISSGSM